MLTVFADTFYWVALTNTADSANEQAKAFRLSLSRGVICTTEAVLIEYLNYFSGWGPEFRRWAWENIAAMPGNSPVIKVIGQNRRIFHAGLELFRARPDKGYSLTDCISMHVMRQLGIKDALTNDRHFEQEGFNALFRE